MAGAAKPMETDREWLWIAGLLGFLLVPAAVGLAVGVTGPVLGDPVEFHVADGDGIGTVDVTVSRVSGDDSERVRAVVVENATDETVYRTTAVGAYAVDISTDAGRGADCTRVVTVRRGDGSTEATVRSPADGGECPVSFFVE
jgi:hypothetical protein